MSARSREFPRWAAAVFLVAALAFAQEVKFAVREPELEIVSIRAYYSFRAGRLVIHAGRKPTAGYEVRIESVKKLPGGTCEVRHVVESPAADAVVAQVLSYPYVEVLLPPECRQVQLMPRLPRR